MVRTTGSVGKMRNVVSEVDEPKGTYSKLYEMTRKTARALPEQADSEPVAGRRSGQVRVVEAVTETPPPKMGRPPREVRRKQKTVYLTEMQVELLDDMHYKLKRRFKVEQSELVGLAIEMLAQVIKMQGQVGIAPESFEAMQQECMQLLGADQER